MPDQAQTRGGKDKSKLERTYNSQHQGGEKGGEEWDEHADHSSVPDLNRW